MTTNQVWGVETEHGERLTVSARLDGAAGVEIVATAESGAAVGLRLYPAQWRGLVDYVAQVIGDVPPSQLRADLARIAERRQVAIVANAAARIGVTDHEYALRVSRGEKWCTGCKGWHPRFEFGADRSRYDGLAARCLASAQRARDSLPDRHIGPVCACGINGAGDPVVDPCCAEVSR